MIEMKKKSFLAEFVIGIGKGIGNTLIPMLQSLFEQKKVSIIIPAFNEEKTIAKVIRTAKKAQINEIIIVDDGSKDNTRKIAKEEEVIVISHRKNKGKGSAMKTGLERAKGEIIVFLDADLRSIKPEQIKKLIEPIQSNKADFVKSYFSGYKPTKLNSSKVLYKPLLKHLFNSPLFIHPLSGQIAGKKEFFDSIEFPKNYGVDISILLDAVHKKLRIKEIDLGKLKHRKRDIPDLEKMSDRVIETMIKKAREFEMLEKTTKVELQ